MEWSIGVEWSQILEWQKFLLHLQIQFRHHVFHGVEFWSEWSQILESQK